MLEDSYFHVVSKAMRGLALSMREASSRLGVSEAELAEFLDGEFDEDIARGCARMCGLDEDALAELPDYEPGIEVPDWLTRLELPFGEDTVNAWVLEADGERWLIDAGAGPDDLLKAWQARGWSAPPSRVLVTHGHHDHVGGLARLGELGAPIMVPTGMSGSEEGGRWARVGPGETDSSGAISFSCVDLSGHAEPALGYWLEGFKKPVLVVGDALFAGSMGGCKTPQAYAKALVTLHDALRSAAGDTLLLCGHGPLTTLAKERKHNPFWPRIKAGEVGDF